MTGVVARYWGLERHPTTNPIPMNIRPRGPGEEYIPLAKDPDLYQMIEGFVDEHNNVVKELKRVRKIIREKGSQHE